LDGKTRAKRQVRVDQKKGGREWGGLGQKQTPQKNEIMPAGKQTAKNGVGGGHLKNVIGHLAFREENLLRLRERPKKMNLFPPERP